jgi:CHAT domain-containing protein
VEIHTHGLVDAEVADASYLALSPEPSGKFAFTASDLKGASLSRHPLVLLAACHAAETAPFLEEGYGLPESFVAAGARAVLAATAPIPDAQSEPFFRPLLDRLQSGAAPAAALRDARVAWRAAHGPSWADSVLLFE